MNKKSKPIESPGSGACPACDTSVPLRADNHKPIAHYHPTERGRAGGRVWCRGE